METVLTAIQEETARVYPVIREIVEISLDEANKLITEYDITDEEQLTKEHIDILNKRVIARLVS